ncbi:MAG: hypothetical protein FK732_11275 [Asgard group archaeon]|nr:hypothetical protein [Asgard group archaeon]
MTSDEIEVTRLAEKFYNSLRGFIVIEESGLPKYIEFLTEEQFDVLLLAGFITSLQALSEIISDEKIDSIETSNSSFLFETRSKYFYVFWIENVSANREAFNPIMMKIISRFEGASDSDIDNTLLISNLTETPEYEKFGQMRVKFQTMVNKESDVYKELFSDKTSKEEMELITKELSGIDGVLVITNNNKVEYSEFPRGKPIFDVPTLSNFLIGLRGVIKNIDPGSLEQITTKNYRFIIHDKQDYFYIFEVIKGLAEEEQLQNTMQRIIDRYEGLRGKSDQKTKLLVDLDSVPEHELLGRLSMEVKGKQNDIEKKAILNRQTSRITFGDDKNRWEKEGEQLNSFMDIYSEVFMTGIISPSTRFFIMRKSPESNDWIKSANGLELEKLLALTALQKEKKPAQVTYGDKLFLLTRITEGSILFSIIEKSNSAIERYMFSMPKVLKRISKNLN